MSEEKRKSAKAPKKSDDGEIVQQPVAQFGSRSRRKVTAELDKYGSFCYSPISIPAGPLSQDMLSLGGFFIGDRA